MEERETKKNFLGILVKSTTEIYTNTERFTFTGGFEF